MTLLLIYFVIFSLSMMVGVLFILKFCLVGLEFLSDLIKQLLW